MVQTAAAEVGRAVGALLEFDVDSGHALFAHCVALSVNAVPSPGIDVRARSLTRHVRSCLEIDAKSVALRLGFGDGRFIFRPHIAALHA